MGHGAVVARIRVRSRGGYSERASHKVVISRDSMKHSSGYLRSHGWLLLRIARSEIGSRFAGSLLGAGWAIVTPVLMLMIYATVYLFVLRVQVQGMTSAGYVVLIFTGLVPFLMTSEALNNGVSSVVANRAVLANTVFPIDLVPVKAVVLAQVTMITGLVVVLVAATFLGQLRATALLFPVIWLLHVLFLIGLLWMLSLINIVFRDLQNFVSVILMFLMIASPIAYTPEMVPAGMKLLITLNPIAYYIIAYQDIIVFGRVPGVQLWLSLIAMSSLTFVGGGYFFVRAKRSLIDYV
jgi:lipopolysaccharide transport system permease protein